MVGAPAPAPGRGSALGLRGQSWCRRSRAAPGVPRGPSLPWALGTGASFSAHRPRGPCQAGLICPLRKPGPGGGTGEVTEDPPGWSMGDRARNRTPPSAWAQGARGSSGVGRGQYLPPARSSDVSRRAADPGFRVEPLIFPNQQPSPSCKERPRRALRAAVCSGCPLGSPETVAVSWPPSYRRQSRGWGSLVAWSVGSRASGPACPLYLVAPGSLTMRLGAVGSPWIWGS